MKYAYRLTCLLIFSLVFAFPVYAAPNTEVQSFVVQSINTLTIIASIATTLFLIKGGYTYITSTGKPEALEDAKKTIRNAFIGLLFVIGAGVFSSLLNQAFTTPASGSPTDTLAIAPIEPVKPQGGLTRILVEAVAGFIANIVQSSTKPITDGIFQFLTSTPSLVKNSVIFNFWIAIVGITNALFAIIIALLGFHVMSASTFGFEELELKHLLPRIALAFLGANMSLFLVDWIINANNAVVTALIHATGGLNKAWIANAFDPSLISIEDTSIITLIFMLLFVILSVVLLLFYIMRLIVISLGAVLAPIIFLLWLLPKFTDFAEISIKTYIVNIFTVFVHVVIIQLASAFLTLPGQSGINPFLSVLVGIALLFTLLKTPQTLVQLAFYTSFNGVLRKVGGQVINVMHSHNSESKNSTTFTNTQPSEKPKLTTRKVIKA